MKNISPSQPLQYLLNTLNNTPYYLCEIPRYISITKIPTQQPTNSENLLTDLVWLLQQKKLVLAGDIIGLLEEELALKIICSYAFQTALKESNLSIAQIAKNNPFPLKILNLAAIIQSQKYTHILGISDRLRTKIFRKIYPNCHNETILGEGAYHAESMLWIINILRKYINHSTNKQLFQEIFESFAATYDICNYFGSEQLNSTAYDFLYNRFLSGKMTIIVTGTTEHSFTIALYNGFIIISNTGESAEEFSGTSIYKLTDASQSITNSLYSLLKLSSTCEDIFTPYNIVDSLAGEYILDISQNPQKYGTCAFVNQKTLIQGLLLLQQAQIKASSDEELLYILKTDQEIFRQSYVDYKSFTTFLRLDAALELCSLTQDDSYALSYNAVESLVAFAEKYKNRFGYLKNQSNIKKRDQRVITLLLQTARSQYPNCNLQPFFSKKTKQNIDTAMKQYETLPHHLKLRP